MEKNKKFVHKSFYPHQYEKEEDFLSKMAGEGWQFIKLHYGFPTTVYEFVKGEPIDYIYQLDYVNKEEDTEDYHSLFADSGWEEFFSWNGVYNGRWYYFRRLRSEGKNDRIFTDIESKYLMYNKLWKKYGLLFLLIISLEINGFRMVIEDFTEDILSFPFGIINIILCLLYVYVTVLYIYLIAGILIKKRQLKQEFDKRL